MQLYLPLFAILFLHFVAILYNRHETVCGSVGCLWPRFVSKNWKSVRKYLTTWIKKRSYSTYSPFPTFWHPNRLLTFSYGGKVSPNSPAYYWVYGHNINFCPCWLLAETSPTLLLRLPELNHGCTVQYSQQAWGLVSLGLPSLCIELYSQSL